MAASFTRISKRLRASSSGGRLYGAGNVCKGRRRIAAQHHLGDGIIDFGQCNVDRCLDGATWMIAGSVGTVQPRPIQSNHGAAVATIARRMGLKARIFVPSIASKAKQSLLRNLGAEVVVAGDVYVEARTAALADAAIHGGLMVHAFEAAETMMGQGTIAPELMQQTNDFDALALSVGGGGLAAGLASWFDHRMPLICGEPELAPTLHAALEANKPVDVDTGGIAADALGCRRIGDLAFDILSPANIESYLVSETDIRKAQTDLWNELRLAVEPAAALPIACLRAMPPDQIAGKRIAVLICGANIDPSTLGTDTLML